MIAYVKGKITEVGPASVTVEAGGIGYELNVSAFCAQACTVGNDAKLPAYLQVNDTGATLFGFADRAEKDMFLRLIGVGGVGAKMALAILGGSTPNDLIACIAKGDTAGLSRIKGIGKKTAERIVLELRDKIAKEIESLPDAFATSAAFVPVNEEAVMALMSLGFNKNEAAAAVAKVQGDNMTTEQIVFRALKG